MDELENKIKEAVQPTKAAEEQAAPEEAFA